VQPKRHKVHQLTFEMRSMINFKNFLINWQISSLQQKIKIYQRRGLEVKLIRSQIAKLNRRKHHH